MTQRHGRTVWAAGVLALAWSWTAGLADPAAPPATAPAAGARKMPAPETQAVARADRPGVEHGRVSRGGGSSLAGWGKTLLALAIVVAVILAVRLVLRRLAPGAKARALPDAVEVLARTHVSARQQLLLVRLGRRVLLVGCGPEGMTTLSEVTDEQEASALLAGAAGRGGKAARRRTSGEGQP